MRLVRSALLAALPLLSGCGGASGGPVPVRVVAPTDKPTLAMPEPDAPVVPAVSADPVAVTKQVILVAIDGVRWQEIFQGVDAELGGTRVPAASGEDLVPHLHALGRRGVVLGDPSASRGISATGPNFASLPGYTEMLTGKAPSCQANECPPTRDDTWLDVCATLPGHQPGDAALVSSWENISLVASKAPNDFPISAGRHHLFGRSIFAKDRATGDLLRRQEHGFPMPGKEDYRADKATAELALRYVETRRPRCMFVGLGDTDEYAHQDDYKAYVGALRRFDAFVGDLEALLGRMGDYGATTTIVVTTDHGRSAGFKTHGHAREASKVFLFAAGGAVPKRGVVAPAEERSLSDIPGTLLALAGAPGAAAGLPELLPLLPQRAHARLVHLPGQ